MRKKTYYSASDITNDLYTSGKEFQYTNGNEFKGLYHKYSTGEVYTGATWNKKTSKKLIPYDNLTGINKVYKKLNPKLKTKYNTPKKYFVTLTKEDIKKRHITRYFLSQLNTKKIIEIDEKQKDEWYSKQIDNALYQILQIEWWIAGETETIIDGAIRKFGVRDKNKNAIQKAKQTIPKIDSYLTNPLEFYVDVDIIIPADIN